MCFWFIDVTLSVHVQTKRVYETKMRWNERIWHKKTGSNREKARKKLIFVKFNVNICKYAKEIFFCTLLFPHQYVFEKKKLTWYNLLKFPFIHSIGLNFWRICDSLFFSLFVLLSENSWFTQKKIFLFGYLHIFCIIYSFVVL